MNDTPEKTSLFHKQKGLKLVTHCSVQQRYGQMVLQEYLAYKFYNEMTDHSLRVRLAEIEYFDTIRGKSIITRKAFFIEDTDDAAKRNGIKEIDIKDIQKAQLDPVAAGRLAVFHYLISNYDWSMHNSTKTALCCHNTKLIGSREEPLAGLIPVPYDFDHSGLVDSPYAALPPALRLRAITDRRYRGFCLHNNEAVQAIESMKPLQPVYKAMVANVPGLTNLTKSKINKFTKKFFADIKDPATAQKKLLDDCRD